MSPAPRESLYVTTVSDTALYQTTRIREDYASTILTFWIIVGIAAFLFVCKQLGKAQKEE